MHLQKNNGDAPPGAISHLPQGWYNVGSTASKQSQVHGMQKVSIY